MTHQTKVSSGGSRPTSAFPTQSIDDLIHAIEFITPRLNHENNTASKVPFLPALPPPAIYHRVKYNHKTEPTMASARFPTVAKAKDEPNIPSGFEMSPALQHDITLGLRGNAPNSSTGHTDQDVDALMDRLYDEAEEYAQRKKREVRIAMKMKMKSEGKQKKLISKDRSLLRSRIEAKVSRVKNNELDKALKKSLRWLIENTDTRHPDKCTACTR